jgi:hypothetical protein
MDGENMAMRNDSWIFRSALLAFLLLANADSACAESGSEKVQIQWSIEREYVPKLRETLVFSGEIKPDLSSKTDSRGLPILYVLVGAISLDHLIKTILDVYRELSKGGTVLVPTSEGLEVSSNPALPAGTIVVRTEKGVRIEAVPSSDRDVTADMLLRALEVLVAPVKAGAGG